MPLNVGDRFPQVPAHGAAGPVDLSARWADGPLVVAFHRLWCPFCHQAANELHAALPEIASAGGQVVVVYRDDPDTVAHKCAARGLMLDCLSDPERGLESAAQIGRFGVLRYAAFSPIKMLRAYRAGGRLGRIRTSLLQGRGTYVIDRRGIVVYAHVSKNAADIPAIGDVVDAVRAAGTGEPPRRRRSAVGA